MSFLEHVCLILLMSVYVGHSQAPGAGLRSRMDIPMGVPDLNDRFSNGLANYVGVQSLPGANNMGNGFAAQERSGGPAAASGNTVGGGFYDTPFSMPQAQTNTGGMTNWYGPEFATSQPQQQPPPGNQPRQNDGSVLVTDLSCSEDYLHTAIGLSNDKTDWLSTVECECRLLRGRTPAFSCYSLCDGPRYGSKCEANISGSKSCPSYKNCGNWTQSHNSDSGAVSCRAGVPVPETVCWLLASATLRADDTPLRPAFYANAAAGCYMVCLCGNDGTVAGELRCLKSPTTNWRFPVYPRSKKHDFSQHS